MENQKVVLERVNEFESGLDRDGMKSSGGTISVKYGNLIEKMRFDVGYKGDVSFCFINNWNVPFEKIGISFDVENIKKDFLTFHLKIKEFNAKIITERRTKQYEASWVKMLQTINRNDRDIKISFVSLEDFLKRDSWNNDIDVSLEYRGKKVSIERNNEWYVIVAGYNQKTRVKDISKVVAKAKIKIGDIIDEEEMKKIQAMQKKDSLNEMILTMNKELKRKDVCSEEIDVRVNFHRHEWRKQTQYFITINEQKIKIFRGEDYKTKEITYDFNSLRVPLSKAVELIKILEK